MQRVQGELVRRTADTLGVGVTVQALASLGHRLCRQLCAQPDTPCNLRARCCPYHICTSSHICPLRCRRLASGLTSALPMVCLRQKLLFLASELR